MAEVNFDAELFSIWTAAAGAESGVELSPASLQLDREQAACLRDLLTEFLAAGREGT